ncbi:MAG: type II toxin-antitoxin system VapC family toxin [Deltaproteobacteria bacterium]|nr:type II toxin-antitoxin system VapC family toxin [Deltaproteobacteria bacterium]
MKYMLDTNICIYLIKKKPPVVIGRLKKKKLSEVCISSITFSELEYGVEKSERIDQNKIALAEFILPIDVMPYDELAATQYGRVRTYLEKKGQTLGALDMLIAAHALSVGVTLVTNNVREFARVPGLKIENWVKM